MSDDIDPPPPHDDKQVSTGDIGGTEDAHGAQDGRDHNENGGHIAGHSGGQSARKLIDRSFTPDPDSVPPEDIQRDSSSDAISGWHPSTCTPSATGTFASEDSALPVKPPADETAPVDTYGLTHPVFVAALTGRNLPNEYAALGYVLRRMLDPAGDLGGDLGGHTASDPADRRTDRISACRDLRSAIQSLHLRDHYAVQAEGAALERARASLLSPIVDELAFLLKFSIAADLGPMDLASAIATLPGFNRYSLRHQEHPFLEFLRPCLERQETLGIDAFAPTIADAQAAVRLLRVVMLTSIHKDEDNADPWAPDLTPEQVTCLGRWMELEEHMTRLQATEEQLLPYGTAARKALCLHLRGRAFEDEVKQSELVVKVPPESPNPVVLGDTSRPSPEETAAEWAGEELRGLAFIPTSMHRVIRGDIPPGTGKDEIAQLKRYDVLKAPQRLAKMISRAQVDSIISVLHTEFPWATRAVDMIGDELRARQHFGSAVLAWAPILLVGLPGCGKSRLAKRLAELTGIAVMPLPLAGAHDSKYLLGTSRGWWGGQPSPIIQQMLARKTASPVVILDEIDKIATCFNGQALSAALLNLLEPETARFWFDPFLQVTCDMSKVLFVATANQLGPLSAPLRSRFQIALVPEPKREHFVAIGKVVLSDIAKSWGVQPEALGYVDVEAVAKRVHNVRELRAAITAMLGREVGEAPTIH